MLSRRVEPNFNRTATLDKIDKKEKSCKSFDLQDFAEREGFEPPVPLSTPVFKTGAFDHSAISPLLEEVALCLKASAKV